MGGGIGNGANGSGGSVLARRAVTVAYVLLILCLALPIVTALVMYTSINVHLARALPDFDPLLARIKSVQRASGVVSGDDPAALRDLARRLEGMAARSSEARHAERLNVVLVRFASDSASRDRDTHGALAENPTARTVGLDLSTLGEAATVLIADEPTIWEISGASADQRARLGVEGPLAFDLVGAHDGLLAGFRIAAFGDTPVAGPGDFEAASGDRRAARTACDSLARWSSFFDVPSDRVRVWTLRDPAHITLGATTVETGDADRRARRVSLSCQR